MKLTTAHETYLRNIAIAKTTYLAAKADADERARDIVRQELAGHQFEIDRLVRVARDSGISIGKIGSHWKGTERLGLGTDDYGTVRASLERTSRLTTITTTAETVEAEVKAERYSLTADGALRITLTDDELEVAKRAVNFDASLATAPHSATFTVERRANGAHYLAPVEGETIAGSYERNPVVFWAYQGAEEAEALEWFAQQSEGVEVAA